MPLKIIEETVEKDIAFLEDVDVKFVSLVRHGAAQMPFRVIKSDEKGGVGNTMMVIQSILVPRHLKLSNFIEKDGMGWLAEAQTEKSDDYEEYCRFEQVDAANFTSTTLKMVKLHGEGIWALAGKLKEGADVDGAITLGAKEASAAKEFPVTPMDGMLPPTAAATAASFRDLFYKELDSMLNVVTGTLNQTGGTLTKRKTTILNSVDAFRSFLVIGLEALGTKAAKIEKTVKTEMEVKDMELFETKEEFATAVGEVIAGTVSGLIADAVKILKKEDSPKKEEGNTDPSKKEDGQATKTADSASNDALKGTHVEEVEKKLNVVIESVAALTKKWDNGLATDPAAGSGDEPPAGKEDVNADDPSNETSKKSVFAGLLVQPAV